jgi:hypothetical protein
MKSALALWAALAAPLLACGGNDDPGGGPDAGGDPDAAEMIDATIFDAPPGACEVTVRPVAQEPGTHVPPIAVIEWSSNPPATGSHYSVWARWNRAYTDPVPRGHYVHNLEHGGVVLLYNCPEGCAEDIAGLQAVLDALPADPKCASPLRTRTLLTPDPLLPEGVRIAAAAWNWTYTAPCLDPGSLRVFIDEHYNQGTESTCAEGAFPP